MTDSVFLTGVLAGLVVAGALGFLSQKIRFAKKQVDKFNSPQSVSLKTDQTPAQVFSGCVSGAISYLLWLTLFLGFFFCCIWAVLRAS